MRIVYFYIRVRCIWGRVKLCKCTVAVGPRGLAMQKSVSHARPFLSCGCCVCALAVDWLRGCSSCIYICTKLLGLLCVCVIINDKSNEMQTHAAMNGTHHAPTNKKTQSCGCVCVCLRVHAPPCYQCRFFPRTNAWTTHFLPICSLLFNSRVARDFVTHFRTQITYAFHRKNWKRGCNQRGAESLRNGKLTHKCEVISPEREIKSKCEANSQRRWRLNNNQFMMSSCMSRLGVRSLVFARLCRFGVRARVCE